MTWHFFRTHSTSGTFASNIRMFLSHTLLICVALCVFSCSAREIQGDEDERHIIAFYNVQNLFHPDDDPHTNDNEFTPEGYKGYTTEIYQDRINRISSALSSMEQSMKGDLLVAGLAEVENHEVLRDLCDTGLPANFNYIHKDSPDPRGIDVALLYNSSLFTPDTHFVASINEPYTEGHQIPRTRDMLFVIGHTDHEKFIISVNHWPSRRGGVAKTSHKRVLAADICRKVTDSLKKELPEHLLIVMGDLNDNPGDESESLIRGIEQENDPSGTTSLFNPFEELYEKGKGSYVYGNNWNMYDQILVSPVLNIYDHGSKKGTPRRSFEGNSYKSGYSDHLPVYIIISSVSPRHPKH